MPTPIQYWSISSQILKKEAEELGLEVELIIPEKNIFYVRSASKEVLFKSTDFGGNSSLGRTIADDKEITYTLLEKNGIPIPRTIYIHDYECDTFDWLKLGDMRYPMIIKPIDEGHGNGVCMNICALSELQKKLESSFLIYPKMIIQEQVSGDECRVLVVLGEVIIAFNRIPPTVMGDGCSTIDELIDRENANNPLRQPGYNAGLVYIQADAELIDYINQQGYTLNTILPLSAQVQLRGNSNIGTGGTARDITSILHEDTKRLCIEVAAKLGLSICGVDVLTSDFTRPLQESGGVILELNAGPGIGTSIEYSSINCGKEILKKLFFSQE